MEISDGQAGSRPGEAQSFTGEVWMDRLAPPGGQTRLSFAAGDDDVHLLVRWTLRSVTTSQQASMTMHHYRRIRDGKIEHFRGSEDTEQTARILTPDLTSAPNR